MSNLYRWAFVVLVLPQAWAQPNEADCKKNVSALQGLWNQLKVEYKFLGSADSKERTARLFLQVNDLKNAKSEFLGTVITIAALGDVPGWLKVRQDNSQALVEKIDNILREIQLEVEAGGEVQKAPGLAKALDVLRERKGVTVCGITSLQLPLTPDGRESLNRFVKDFQAEIDALAAFEQDLGGIMNPSKR